MNTTSKPEDALTRLNRINGGKSEPGETPVETTEDQEMTTDQIITRHVAICWMDGDLIKLITQYHPQSRHKSRRVIRAFLPDQIDPRALKDRTRFTSREEFMDAFSGSTITEPLEVPVSLLKTLDWVVTSCRPDSSP